MISNEWKHGRKCARIQFDTAPSQKSSHLTTFETKLQKRTVNPVAMINTNKTITVAFTYSVLQANLLASTFEGSAVNNVWEFTCRMFPCEQREHLLLLFQYLNIFLNKFLLRIVCVCACKRNLQYRQKSIVYSRAGTPWLLFM